MPLATKYGTALLFSSLLLSLTLINRSWNDFVSVIDNVVTITPRHRQLATLEGSGSGLVGWWKFDEGSGTTVTDSSGNNNTGTLTNGPTWVAGQVGGALQFDGVDDYIQIGSNVGTISSGTFTISAFVLLSGVPINTGSIVGGSSASYPNFGINPSRKLSLVKQGVAIVGTSNTVMDLNKWYHVAVSYDGSNYQFYLDGVSDGGGNKDYVFAGTNTRMGYYNYATTIKEYLQGTLDNVRVYNRVLSPQEISELHSVDLVASSPADPITPPNSSTYTLTLSKSGTGTGTISGGAISCGSICTQTSISSGTSITLSAVSDADSTFTGWSGGNCSGIGTCTTIITTNTNITANLTRNVLPPSGPTTYYIDYENGNDLNNGTSISTPWKLAPGMPGFQGSYTNISGNIFIFKGGVQWPSSVFPYVARGGTKITSDKNWHTGNVWTEPVFDGGGSFPANTSIISIYAVDNIEVSNIKIQNLGNGSGQARAMSITGASRVLIKSLIITPNAQHGIVITTYANNPKSDLIIKNNKFTRVTNSIEVGASGPISNFEISDNEFYDVGPNLIPSDHGDGVHIFGVGAVSGFKFFNNRYYGDWTSGSAATGQLYLEGNLQDGLIYNNIFGFDNLTQPNGSTWFFSPGLLVGGCVSCKIFNNTFYSGGVMSGEKGSKTGMWWGAGAVEFKNNLIYGVGYGIMIDGVRATLVSDYNVIAVRPGGVIGGVFNVSPLNFNRSFSGWQTLGYDLHSTSNIPSFVQGTVQPASDSIVIDRGVNLSSYFTTDILGTPRPQGSAWDIGAYEYYSGQPTIPIVTAVSGSCSTTVNLCASGTFSDTADNSTHSLWSCLGSNGGTTASCSLSKTTTPTPGLCSTTVNLCTTGTPLDTPDSTTHSLWSCQGSNGGSNTSCSLPKTTQNPVSTPPTFSSITITKASDNSTISFTTDKPTSFQIEYGLTTAYGNQTALFPAFVNYHTTYIPNLNSNTTYHYRIKVRDVDGNEVISPNYTFTTLASSVTTPVTTVITPVVTKTPVKSSTSTTKPTNPSTSSGPSTLRPAGSGPSALGVSRNPSLSPDQFSSIPIPTSTDITPVHIPTWWEVVRTLFLNLLKTIKRGIGM